MSKDELEGAKKSLYGKGLTFDSVTEKDEQEEKRIKDMSVAGKVAIGVTFLAEIVAASATGRMDFLGSANQVAEKVLGSPKELVGFAKEMAESGLGRSVALGLKFVGSPPVKRLLKVGFSIATFTALGAASGGAVPIAAFSLGMAAIAVNTVRDYRSAHKMKKNVELLDKTTELKKEQARQNSIVKDLNPELQKQLNDFIAPEAATKSMKGDGNSLRDKAIKAILPKKYADKMLENSYLRELPSTIFFNALECSGAIVTGNVADIVSVMTMGTISENKERTEHRELKNKVKNTIAADMEAMGFGQGKKFRNAEEVDKAIEKQKFIIDRLAKAKEDGKLSNDPGVQTKIISEAIESYKQMDTEREEAKKAEWKNKNIFQKAMHVAKKISKSEPAKFMEGYVKTWIPGSEVYNPAKTTEHVIKKREFHHAQIQQINDPHRSVASGLEKTLQRHSSDVQMATDRGEAIAASKVRSNSQSAGRG